MVLLARSRLDSLAGGIDINARTQDLSRTRNRSQEPQALQTVSPIGALLRLDDLPDNRLDPCKTRDELYGVFGSSGAAAASPAIVCHLACQPQGEQCRRFRNNKNAYLNLVKKKASGLCENVFHQLFIGLQCFRAEKFQSVPTFSSSPESKLKHPGCVVSLPSHKFRLSGKPRPAMGKSIATISSEWIMPPKP
jgi:hypothetical protein